MAMLGAHRHSLLTGLPSSSDRSFNLAHLIRGLYPGAPFQPPVAGANFSLLCSDSGETDKPWFKRHPCQ
ncbi:hypothetical protein FOCG_17956 [Fusarium oxysporum f. sp. radicis-lycopersici 26381]|nr:hypothetical protein FOWG_16958 [Fusarium oxysporum f. sp. lycopersici MN25]EXL39436.1 hypothetical protein FOCG_17956 [Fusarium oxysporum f. sp. radicis-lycopersici 26381]